MRTRCIFLDSKCIWCPCKRDTLTSFIEFFVSRGYCWLLSVIHCLICRKDKRTLHSKPSRLHKDHCAFVNNVFVSAFQLMYPFCSPPTSKTTKLFHLILTYLQLFKHTNSHQLKPTQTNSNQLKSENLIQYSIISRPWPSNSLTNS